MQLTSWLAKQHMTGDVTHHATVISFLLHILHYCWILHETATLQNQ